MMTIAVAHRWHDQHQLRNLRARGIADGADQFAVDIERKVMSVLLDRTDGQHDHFRLSDRFVDLGPRQQLVAVLPPDIFGIDLGQRLTPFSSSAWLSNSTDDQSRVIAESVLGPAGHASRPRRG